MKASDLNHLDRRAVRAAFARAAATYDDAAVLQREVADRLLARLDYINLRPMRLLDLGCGTGSLARRLSRRYASAEIVALDLALPMVQAARRQTTARLPFGFGARLSRCRYANGDAESLPFADACFDLVVSNLTLQWCDPERVFRECRRVLRPGGLFLFTTFGPDTLKELRAAWRAVDRQVHVHDFIDMHDLGDALVRARFADPVMDVEPLTLTYAKVSGLLRDLKAIGAHNAVVNRRQALTGKDQFARFEQAYERFRDSAGRLPASHEVIFGHAWIPEHGDAVAGPASGQFAVPLTALRRRPG